MDSNVYILVSNLKTPDYSRKQTTYNRGRFVLLFLNLKNASYHYSIFFNYYGIKKITLLHISVWCLIRTSEITRINVTVLIYYLMSLSDYLKIPSPSPFLLF